MEILASFVIPQCQWYKIKFGDSKMTSSLEDFDKHRASTKGHQVMARIKNVEPMCDIDIGFLYPRIVICSLDIEVLNDDNTSFSNTEALMSNPKNIISTISLCSNATHKNGVTKSLMRYIVSIGS